MTIARYLRLSREDEELGESSSICSQRKLTEEYRKSHVEFEQNQVKEYCDDGYTGLNLRRPGIQALFKAMERGEIQCVLVKDLSRISRDYLTLGYYLEQIFPQYGVRLIAINDQYDSAARREQTMEIGTTFQTLLYDLYSKDLSVKVQASKQNQIRQGRMMGQPPFGYQWEGDSRKQVMEHPQEAAVVRYIYDLAASSCSVTQIAQKLQDERIETVRQMRKNRCHGEHRRPVWNEQVVRQILSNRFYLGELWYGKSRRIPGSDRRAALPEQEWKVIRGHHAPLIPESLFLQVQRKQQQRKKPGKEQNQTQGRSPLAGKLYCRSCGYALSYRAGTGGNASAHFACRMHARLGMDTCCTYVNERKLCRLILDVIDRELQESNSGIGGNSLRVGTERENQRREERISREGSISRKSGISRKSRISRMRQNGITGRQIRNYEKYVDGRMEESAYRVWRDRLKEERQRLTKETERETESAQKAWKGEDMDQETVAIAVFVDRIYLDKNKKVKVILRGAGYS